jgi:acyl dehydratase
MNWVPGQALEPLTKPPVTVEQLKEYAKAADDPNPIHLDEAFAKEAGFPSVIVHGMISMAFMADHLIFNFPEKTYAVVRMKARFRKVTFPGDVLRCEGKVKKISPSGVITVLLSAKNQRGETTTDGEAEVRPI